MTNLAKHLEKINSELDISVDSSENIIAEFIEEKVTWSEYLINILNTYFGFIWIHTPKFLYKNNENEGLIHNVSENDNDFFTKINEVRKNNEDKLMKF